MATTIKVEGKEITIISVDKEDYVSLTDMIKGHKDAGYIIRNWLRGRPTLDFLCIWEKLNNPNFNSVGADSFIKGNAGKNSFSPSVKDWVNVCNATGIYARAGRYGGTYAHRDIAFDFGAWISPSFRYLLIREFQRLKTEEARRLNTTWNFSRFLSKINHGIHTHAIKGSLPSKVDDKNYIIFASEVDLLNIVVFGIRAKEWKSANPSLAKQGNMRDFASEAELIVLSNMESLNALMISKNISKERRAVILSEQASIQLSILANDPRIKAP